MDENYARINYLLQARKYLKVQFDQGNLEIETYLKLDDELFLQVDDVVDKALNS